MEHTINIIDRDGCVGKMKLYDVEPSHDVLKLIFGTAVDIWFSELMNQWFVCVRKLSFKAGAH
jgi:hypothetical protein